jgi:hypothetical protein
MKKFLIYGFVLAISVTAGCKKDKQNNQTYLLSRQITDDSADGLPIDTASYTYDSNNRVTTIVDGTTPNKQTITITYDSQSRVLTGKKFDNNGNLFIEYDFFYRGDTSGYIFHGGTLADTAYFTFNNKHQVTQITSGHSGYNTFSYDSRGNVSASQSYANDGSFNLTGQGAYSYDDMKNPFSETAPNNLFLMYVVFIDDPSTLINNVVNKNGEPYAIVYNSAGFPTSAVVTTYNSTAIKLYYNYIVK